MKLSLTMAALAAVVLVSCEDTTDSGYTQVSDVTSWNYDCGNGNMMRWEFKEGEKGRFIFNSGSIMMPQSTDPNDRNFTRQDATVFTITGDANQWSAKNLSTGNVTTCVRTR